MAEAARPTPGLGRAFGLTVRQPWAKAIVDGEKSVENRSWLPRMEPGDLIFVQASRFGGRSELAEWSSALRCYAAYRAAGGPRYGVLEDHAEAVRAGGSAPLDHARSATHGAILGAVVYRGSCESDVWMSERDRAWFVGPHGWKLSGAVAIDPVPHVGRLGLWRLPEGAVPALRSAYFSAVRGAQEGRITRGDLPGHWADPERCPRWWCPCFGTGAICCDLCLDAGHTDTPPGRDAVDAAAAIGAAQIERAEGLLAVVAPRRAVVWKAVSPEEFAMIPHASHPLAPPRASEAESQLRDIGLAVELVNQTHVVVALPVASFAVPSW